MAGAAAVGHQQNATASGVTGTLAGTITPTGAIAAAHGVSGTLAGTLTPTGAVAAARGASGTLAGTITPTGAIAAQYGVMCLDADWGADVQNLGTKGTLDGNDFAGVDGSSVIWRWAQKFDVAALAGSTITKVELIVNVVDIPGTPTTWDVGPYGTAGTDDPEADVGAVMYLRCANTGTYVNDTTTFATGGLRTLDLGSQAVTDLQAALGGGIFSVSCRYNNEVTANNGSAIEEYSGGSAPPELCVTFTPGSGVTGTLAGTVSPTGAISAAHGVSATLAGTVTPTGAIQARHGVSGTLSGSIAPTGAIAAARGSSGTLAGTITPTGAIAAARGASATLAGSIVPTGAISATFGDQSVTGTLAGVIVPFGSIQAHFQSSRAAAVKHYQAAEPEKPKRRRRKKQPIDQLIEQLEDQARWEMPAARQPPPLPGLELELPPLPRFEAPELPEPIAPPAPVLMAMAGVIVPWGNVRMLAVHPDYLRQAQIEDEILLGLV